MISGCIPIFFNHIIFLFLPGTDIRLWGHPHSFFHSLVQEIFPDHLSKAGTLLAVSTVGEGAAPGNLHSRSALSSGPFCDEGDIAM